MLGWIDGPESDGNTRENNCALRDSNSRFDSKATVVPKILLKKVGLGLGFVLSHALQRSFASVS